MHKTDTPSIRRSGIVWWLTRATRKSHVCDLCEGIINQWDDCWSPRGNIKKTRDKRMCLRCGSSFHVERGNGLGSSIKMPSLPNEGE